MSSEDLNRTVESVKNEGETQNDEHKNPNESESVDKVKTPERSSIASGKISVPIDDEDHSLPPPDLPKDDVKSYHVVEPETEATSFNIPSENEPEIVLQLDEEAQDAAEAAVKEEHEEASEENIEEKQEDEEEEEEKKEKAEEDAGDFEKLMKGDEDGHSESSFSLLNVEAKEPEAEEAAEEQEQEQKKVKKKRKRKSKKKSGSQESSYSSLMLTEETTPISGDFSSVPLGARKPSLGTLTSSFTESQISDEEEKVESDEGEEKMSEYDRYQYYLLYDKIEKQYREEKAKNSYLLRKLAHYFQRKKMFHVLFEGKLPIDTLKKYEKQLDDFERLTDLSTKEQASIQTEIAQLKEKCATKEREAQICFEKLQHDEYEIGKEIVTSEAGQGYEEKTFDRYLKRQKIQLSNLTKIRLDYIKIRNKVNETQEALDALDNLGPNLRLIDYEQLKLDNRNLHDKLEEKELELTKVRIKCQNAMQILAHRREKTAALDSDIYHLNERLTGVTGEFEDVREQLNELKQERDFYRSAIEKTKKNAGLLSKPKLLKDMSDTIEESQSLSEKLEVVRDECISIADKVKKIRKNMGSATKLDKIKAKMMGKKSTDIDIITMNQFGNDTNSGTKAVYGSTDADSDFMER